jgi:ribonuclease VapC
MAHSVLDASAVLAWLQSEPGTDLVDPLLTDAAISAVNWSEILQKVGQKGKSVYETADLLKALGLEVEPLTEEDAVTAAELWSMASSLSLADRCCLALARRLQVSAVTAERSWAGLPLAAKIMVIR